MAGSRSGWSLRPVQLENCVECDHDNFLEHGGRRGTSAAALATLTLVARCARLRARMKDYEEFERRVDAVVVRFFAQNTRAAPSAAERSRFAAQLRQLVAERGLPTPLAPHE